MQNRKERTTAPYKRSARVSELLREIIADTIEFKVKDAEAHKATVQKVDVSPNLRRVKVYVTVHGDKAQRKISMEALQHACGSIRHEIGVQSDLKYVPDLEFIYDDSLEYAARIESILRSLKEDGE